MSDPIVLDGLTLHPELQFLLELRERRNLAPLSSLPIDQIRSVTLRESITAAGEPTPVAAVSDLTVDGAVGPLRARLYAPRSQWSDLLVFFHGGGFVFGDVDTHDGACRLLGATGGFAVLSVEYRLAPEHPHPAAVDDAWAAWQWVVANVDTLPGATTEKSARLAIGGDSAGGFLAAVTCQTAVRTGFAVPLVQMLIYPATGRGARTRSMELFADGFFLTRDQIDFFERCLAGDQRDDPGDYRAHPMVGELAGLPSALVVTGGFDPLRDGGEAYAAAMAAAGVPVVVRRYDAMIHGFINMIGFSPAARAATIEIAEQTAALLSLAVPSSGRLSTVDADELA
jgi:acetyl esterase